MPIEARIEKCICVGCSELSKAYKLYNPITKKAIINRDVEFKGEAWDDNLDETIVVGTTIHQAEDEGEEQEV